MFSFLFASIIFFLLFILSLLRLLKPLFLRFSRFSSSTIQQLIKMADLAGMRCSPFFAHLLLLSWPLSLLILKATHRRRYLASDRQLPDALSLIGGAIKAGLSLPQAIEVASRELTGPLGEEIALVASKLRLGQTIEEALSFLTKRLPTEDISLVVQSVTVLRRTGGNLIETFSTLSATVEGRLAVEERISLLTAQGVYQGMMLIAMPWMLGLMLHLIAPEYLEPLYSTRLGFTFMGVGIALEILGAFWIRQIVSIRV